MVTKKPARRAAATRIANLKTASPRQRSASVTRATSPARKQDGAASAAAKGKPPRSDRAQLQHAVEQFLYRQAEILDSKRWQAYIDLFTDDGVYWMPADPSHEHWDGVPAIFAEDKNLMTVRMKRVLHPDAWSQRPLWGTNHVVGNVIIESASARGDVVARSRFHMMELRRDSVRHFAGAYVHHLKQTKDGFRIAMQRVDMTNAQAAYEYVLQVWV
jgi:benzoate/toluate 1,2-dioxygenase subunit beta